MAQISDCTFPLSKNLVYGVCRKQDEQDLKIQEKVADVDVLVFARLDSMVDDVPVASIIDREVGPEAV